MGMWCIRRSQPRVSTQCCILYYNGLNFTLRGGDEHWNLSLSQITFANEPDPADPTKVIKFVEYTENGSKNWPGGSKQLNLYNKTVHYEQPLLGDWCHVHLLQLYVSKLPSSAIEKNYFYCKPLAKFREDLWYSSQPLGHNTLDKQLKQIFQMDNFKTENKTNHSLWATSISRMYHANVPEKLIMERSGMFSIHSFLAALTHLPSLKQRGKNLQKLWMMSWSS